MYIILREREKERETREDLETKRKTKKRHAREKPLTRERARNQGLDPKLKREQETRFEGCGICSRLH